MSSCNDVSNALSYMGNESTVDVSLMPLGMKATHDRVVNGRCTTREAEVPRGSDASEDGEVY